MGFGIFFLLLAFSCSFDESLVLLVALLPEIGLGFGDFGFGILDLGFGFWELHVSPGVTLDLGIDHDLFGVPLLP